MVRASPTAALTGRRRYRSWSGWPTRSRQGGICRAATSGSGRPDPIDASGVLAAAANALDLCIERGVLAVDGIVRIAQVLLRRHLIGARLAVADRRLARPLRLIFYGGGSSAATLCDR